LGADAGNFRSSLVDTHATTLVTFEGGSCLPAMTGGTDGGCGAGTLGDLHNRGTCGHDCHGGACEAGACVPLPDGVLATGQESPLAIAVDATNVYWLNQSPFEGPTSNGGEYHPNGSVMKCAIAGCNNNPTILASGWTQPGASPVVSQSLVVDSGMPYWVGNGAILSSHGSDRLTL
jgi:hypothetical protein